MRFKQNSLALLYGYLGFVLFGAAGLTSLILGGHNTVQYIMIILVIAAVVLGNWFMGANTITINETEILCSCRRGVCWRYQWSEIHQLKQATVLRDRAVIIVPNEQPTDPASLYFQLGKKAKQAIERYHLNVKQ